MEDPNNILEQVKVMAAVKHNGRALQFASEDLQRYRAIIMASVKQNRWALKDASEDLQRYREITMAAVK